MTVLLLVSWVVLVVMALRSTRAVKAWNDLYRQMLGHADDLAAQIKSAHQEINGYVEQVIAAKMEQARLQGQLEAAEKGRVFDQVLVNNSIERAERFRRVLEAVLKGQGCDDASIAGVIEKTENDTPEG